jgi:hypothetical protein
VFVKGMGTEVGEADLRALFADVEGLKEVRVARDHETHVSRVRRRLARVCFPPCVFGVDLSRRRRHSRPRVAAPAPLLQPHRPAPRDPPSPPTQPPPPQSYDSKTQGLRLCGVFGRRGRRGRHRQERRRRAGPPPRRVQVPAPQGRRRPHRLRQGPGRGRGGGGGPAGAVL